MNVHRCLGVRLNLFRLDSRHLKEILFFVIHPCACSWLTILSSLDLIMIFFVPMLRLNAATSLWIENIYDPSPLLPNGAKLVQLVSSVKGFM